MGGGSFSSEAYASYSTTTLKRKSTSEVFQKSSMLKDFDPLEIGTRESRDSEDNPESNAIIIAFDVTGSMSPIIDSVVRNLDVLMTEIHERKPVSDPHICCMGVGDVEYDHSPLQVTQFEADLRIAKQLTDIYLENGGGGNVYESYTLPWYFAATKTSIDCFEKRGKKGYLFTIGDELPNPILRASHINRVMGAAPQKDLNPKEILALAEEKYHVFHIMVGTSGSLRSGIKEAWGKVMGQKAIALNDHHKLAQTIVSTMQLNEGMDIDDVLASWGKGVAKTVNDSLGGINFRR